jgi:large subunit ribosomal protein L29
MKVSEIREKSEDEIKAQLIELKKEYFNMRFQHKSGQLGNTVGLPNIRKDIARVMTIAKEKNINLS